MISNNLSLIKGTDKEKYSQNLEGKHWAVSSGRALAEHM